MNDSPRIVGNCCWGIMNLAEQLGTGESSDTSPISPFYDGVIDALLRTANRYVARSACSHALAGRS
jgi:importin subunit beta-1